MQAADQNGFVPAQTTVWDYIAQKTDNPEFAKAVKALHSTPHTGRSRSNVGKPPVVLHNVCASCREDKPGQRLSSTGTSRAPAHPPLAPYTVVTQLY